MVLANKTENKTTIRAVIERMASLTSNFPNTSSQGDAQTSDIKQDNDSEIESSSTAVSSTGTADSSAPTATSSEPSIDETTIASSSTSVPPTATAATSAELECPSVALNQAWSSTSIHSTANNIGETGDLEVEPAVEHDAGEENAVENDVGEGSVDQVAVEAHVVMDEVTTFSTTSLPASIENDETNEATLPVRESMFLRFRPTLRTVKWTLMLSAAACSAYVVYLNKVNHPDENSHNVAESESPASLLEQMVHTGNVADIGTKSWWASRRPICDAQREEMRLTYLSQGFDKFLSLLIEAKFN